MELLAPAGSYEALVAAVQSGADAVYVGGSRFSARGSAQNFSDEELEKWIKYCHLYGVEVHVAANTLIKERETDEFLEYIGFLNKISVDAVIMQDLGMVYATRQLYPELKIHASTQMTCASLKTAKEFEKIGFSRIVLARELDKESIIKIKKAVNCEIEVFVHGAICMSYSGQCLMSSMIGGRSGNRGFCAQPCRLEYRIVNSGKNIKKGYLLSPKDMSLAEHIAELKKAGVDSLKIEGRLKRSEYVACVVGVYRDLIDNNKKPTEKQKQELLDAFNRSGFTDGYFTNQKGSKMMAYETPSNVSENKFSDEVKKRAKIDASIRKIPVDISCELNIGKPLHITMSDGKNTASVYGEEIAEYAINTPFDNERLKKQLSKLGQTVFISENISVIRDEMAVISIGEINSVRRKAADKLSQMRMERKPGKVTDFEMQIENRECTVSELTASVKTVKQAKMCIKYGIKMIYAPREVIEALGDLKETIFIEELPPIDRENKNLQKVFSNNILISSLGQSDSNKNIFCNFRINALNSYTLEFLKDYSSVTLSPELTIREIKEMKKPCDTEVICYGRIPLMVFENCPQKALGICQNNKNEGILKDRMNEEFPLMCSKGCFLELLNSKPVYMADKLDDLKNTGVKYFRLMFTTEDDRECENVICEYKRALGGEKVDMRKENTFTRGHFYKGVL